MRNLFKNSLSGGSVLVGSLFIANFCNFLFNAFLGRTLSFEEFGLVTLVTTIWNLVNMVFGSMGSAINHRVAYLTAHDGKRAGVTFYHSVIKKILFFTLIVSLIWVALSPLLAEFFHVPTTVLWYMTPIFLAGAFASAGRGYLIGVVAFALAGLLVGLEAITKLVIAGVFVGLGSGSSTYLAIPISAIVIGIVTAVFLNLKTRGTVLQQTQYRFPRRFFSASLISGLAVTAFLSVDVILAKHYLSPEAAGEYAFLSLVGKMVYFFGSLLNTFVITLIAREEGLGKDTNTTFYKLFFGVVGLTSIAYFGVGLLGSVTVPILFGAKAVAIIPYLQLYSLAIAIYTVTSFIVLYHLARKHYVFSFIGLGMAILVVLGIVISHNSIFDITLVLLYVSILNFFVTCLLHFLKRNGEFLLRNFIDLIDVFFPLSQDKPVKQGKSRILIFNWRDTKHAYAGGAEVYIHELAKEWVKKGHAVTVFCGNDSKSVRNDVVEGVRVIRRGGFYFVYVWAFVYYIFQFRGKFDYIVDCHNGIPFFTPLYVKERVTCVIHHIHQEVFRTHLSPPFALFAQVLENRLMPLLYKDVAFVAVSESTKNAMEALGISEKETQIIHNGIDTRLYAPGIKNKKPLILYVGRLKYYKTINVFIKAAVLIHKQIPSATFVIAGEGEERKGLQQLVERVSGQNFISFVGKVTENEKIELQQRAWVSVNPSLMEGWGITTIEANACGTVVVASDVPGLRDSVQDGKSGLLVPYGDAEAFAQAVSMLILDTKKRHAMEKEAVSWANTFRWEESAKKLLEVMRQNGKKEPYAVEHLVPTIIPFI